MTAHAEDGNREREFETTPEELRRTARFLEAEGLDAVAELSRLAFPLAIGGLKDFPRPSPEDRAASEGIERLRRCLEDAAAELYALASARDAGLALPRVLLIPVFPYLEAYREAAPEEQRYLMSAPNERVDEDEFTPVDVDKDDQAAPK
jgi:hypothetical protein